MRTAPRVVDEPEPNDTAVVAAVLAGDVRRFAVLVRRHNQTLFRTCRAILRDDTEAEDAVQAAWIAGYRGLRGFRGDARFRTWMTRIAVHEACARTAQRKRLATVALEDVPMRSDDDPEQAVSAQEAGRVLERLIDVLPEGLRHVLVLRDVVELDTAETAQCLGIGEEAVRVRLHRARAAVAHALGARGGGALEAIASDVWRFDGDRCARVLARVMAAIDGHGAGDGARR